MARFAKRRLLFIIPTLMLVGSTLAEDPKPAESPKSPVSGAESLQHFRLTPGLRIDLVAAEPDVVDPIAVRFDERGRMWVVEMRDYPNGPATGKPAMSQIRLLQDKDQDGRFESSEVFADKLLFATGVQPWQGGVIVTMAGKVVYLKDTNGDNRADQSEVWYQGFAEDNPQLRANHPTLGLDNHIYVANGLRGGSVIDAQNQKAKAVSISGRDFRFHPFKRTYEATSGVGQFGLTFDDFGNRFVCSNRNPFKHIVLPNRYLSRNSSVAIPAIAHDVATPGADSRIFPISRAWTTSTLHAGQFTAACGATMYGGDLLPAEFRGNGFTCDPTGNLVHREVLAAQGATFTSKVAREGVEFLASTDEWFRPVNMEVGPDGALYVVDMYRAVIEHPQWVPEELKGRADERYGDDRGRVYRIAPQKASPGKLASLSEANDSELIAQLAHKNSWRAETAVRLLYERQSKQTKQQLTNEATRGATAAGRVRAMWLLKGLEQLDLPVVVTALADRHPRVREHAIVLAESWLDEQAVRRRVRQLSADEDARVRFQVALSLTPAQSDDDVQALSEIAVLSAADPWTRSAVRVSCGSRAAPLALAVLSKLADNPSQLSQATTPELLRDVLAAAASQAGETEREELLAGVARLGRAKNAAARIQFVALRSLSSRRASLANMLKNVADKPIGSQLRESIALSKKVALESKSSHELRLEAIDLLSQVDGSEVPLAQLAIDGEPDAIRLKAISAPAGKSTMEPWGVLLARFSSESPAVRRAILDGVLSRTDRTARLLDAIEEKAIKPGEIDRVRTNRLLKVGDAKLRVRVKQLLADAIPADRKKVLAEYQSVLKMQADPKRGVQVFKKNCATCHRVGSIGVDVAPDIADSRTRKPTQLLTDILQPNRAIDSNYVSYTVITEDGRSLSGVLSSESAAGVTLKQAEGKTIALPRSEIEEIRSNGISLMPEGLEKNIPQQDMADLISFIKNWRYLDGRTPLRSQRRD